MLPASVLYREEKSLPPLPAVEHYAGTRTRLEKALALQAVMAQDGQALFDITGDCEDGAPVGNEHQHAAIIADLIASPANRCQRVGARIHDPSHPCWRDDLDTLLAGCGQQLAYVTFPKINGIADAQACLAALREGEARHGIDRAIPAHFLIETHGALAEVHGIARLPGVETLDFGIMDFVSAHHGAIPAAAMQSPLQFTHPLLVRAKAEIAAAALAAGVIPAHNVCTTLNDADAVRADAARARQEFGFLRMWSIHPQQIAPILAAMRPTADEIAAAIRILSAAQDADWGPINDDGRLHDRASYRYYRDLLGRAAVTGLPLPAAIKERGLV